MRAKIHRDTALRHRRRELDTDTERRECVNILTTTNNNQQSTMGRGVGYNRTGRRTDADACLLTHRKGVGWRCCWKHTGNPQSSASLPKPAQKEAMELWKRDRERSVRIRSDSTSSSLRARSLLPPRLPPFIGQEGSRSGINFLPTESNYLGSTYVPNSLLYTT